MTPDKLAHLAKQLAADQGFSACGVAGAGPIGREDYLRGWLAAGRAGTMRYLYRDPDRRLHPGALLEGARSVIVVALLYHQPREYLMSKRSESLARGRVAKYAWGEDYHVVMKDKLFALVGRLRAKVTEPFEHKVCVDTAPLLEREVAAAAGIGWIGKNTMVLNQGLGSYFFLGAVLTTLEITPDAPVADHCGTCTACLDACPTDAFPTAYEMDASRCISYLTIEHRGEISYAVGEKMGDWVFGCDICQEVCPYNRHAPLTKEPRLAIRPPGPEPVLEEILHWSPDDYRAILRGSAMKRAKLEMLQRNARIAQNNLGKGEEPDPCLS